ncbi:MAG: hypothetical protein MI861_15170 [Pirellulales bacterium]|nr:hypothetical protein [Pirellulales bacterium]
MVATNFGPCYGIGKMNLRVEWIVGFVVSFIVVLGGEARAQYWGSYLHPHPYHVPAFTQPLVPPLGFGAGYCAGCGCLGCVDPICAAPPPIVVAPLFLNINPIIAAPPAIREPAAGKALEGAVDRLLAPAEPRGAFDGLDEIRRRASVLKASTPAGRQRADRLISIGDTAFADQIYARATSKYREAIARAPDYAAAHFRLAHAYVATRQYNLALKSALIALELAGSGRRDGFSLAEMYRGNKFARQQHDAKLVDASLREPEDGGLQFLIGITLHYGGNPLKAREHFRRAAELDGVQQAYVRHFLPIVPVKEAPQPGAGLN